MECRLCALVCFLLARFPLALGASRGPCHPPCGLRLGWPCYCGSANHSRDAAAVAERKSPSWCGRSGCSSYPPTGCGRRPPIAFLVVNISAQYSQQPTRWQRTHDDPPYTSRLAPPHPHRPCPASPLHPGVPEHDGSHQSSRSSLKGFVPVKEVVGPLSGIAGPKL